MGFLYIFSQFVQIIREMKNTFNIEYMKNSDERETVFRGFEKKEERNEKGKRLYK